MHIYWDGDFLLGIVLIELFSIEIKLSSFKEFENISYLIAVSVYKVLFS